MEGALPFRVEHPGPRRCACAGGEPRQVPLDRDAQLLLNALGSLCECDGAAGSVTLAQRPEGVQQELSVTVEGYLPRLAARAGTPPWTGMLYAKGQSPFHAAVSLRYFELLRRSRDS